MTVVKATALPTGGEGLLGTDVPDPYCLIRVGDAEQSTKAVKNTIVPEWNNLQMFRGVPSTTRWLRFDVLDKDTFSKDDLLCTFSLPRSVAAENGVWLRARKKKQAGQYRYDL